MSDIQIDTPDLTVVVQRINDTTVNVSYPTTTIVVTGSLIRYAESALTASYALTASHIDNFGTIGSVSGQFTGSFTGDGSQLSGVIAATASFIAFPTGLDVTGSLNVTGSITGSGLLMTTRAASSASAGATYTTAEQDLINQMKATLIKYGMLT